MEIVLKRPSQVACGLPHNARAHLHLMCSIKGAIWEPVDCVVAQEEGLDKKCTLVWG